VDWIHALKPWFEHGIYPALFLTLFICGVGLPIPEEAIFIAAGYIGHKIGASQPLLYIAGMMGIMAGDSIPFYLGSHIGMRLLDRGPWNKLVTPRLRKAAQDYFQKHGAKTVFVARFTAGFRTPAFPIAGSSGMRYSVFFLWDLLGALISCPTSIWLAYVYGEKATAMISRFSIYAAVSLAILAAAAYLILHRRQVPTHNYAHVGVASRATYRFSCLVLRVLMWPLFRYEVVGKENIPEGAVILAANHASFIDPLILSCCTRRFIKYLMYKSFYESWARPLFDHWRVIPVDEQNYVGALKSGLRALRDCACIGIFPEGAVSYDGHMQPAKEGALFLAQKAGVPVVPITIRGSHAALPRGSWLPRFRKVTVLVGNPVRIPENLSREEIETALKQLMAEIGSKLDLDSPVPPEPPVIDAHAAKRAQPAVHASV